MRFVIKHKIKKISRHEEFDDLHITLGYGNGLGWNGSLTLFYEENTNEVLGFDFYGLSDSVKKIIHNSLFLKFTKDVSLPLEFEVDNSFCLELVGYNKKENSLNFSFGPTKEEVVYIKGKSKKKIEAINRKLREASEKFDYLKKGTGIDLGKGVVIRIDPKTKEWLGVSIFGISKILKKK